MKKLFTITAIFIMGCNLFSQNWQSYPYSPPNSFLSFPADDGYHSAPNTSTEWWYINLTLIGSAPQFKKYSVMLCYFRFVNMRIFNIACETDNTFNNDVLQAFPTLIAQQDHWELTYTKLPPNPVNDFSRWTYPIDGKPYSYKYHAEDPVHNDALDVTVISSRCPMVVGGNGYIALGDQGDSSFYYSYSNMTVTGTLKYNGITDTITQGLAWIDRQYGPFTVGVNSNNLYEWFSMQLDVPGTTLGIPQSPSEYNIWQIYSDSTSVPYEAKWRLVTGLYPDNSQDTSSSYIFERTGYWYDQSEGKYYSQGWRFINPTKDITVDLTPPVKDQLVNVNVFRFWEGGVNLKGVFQDQPVEGVGFAEIVAGRNFQVIIPSIPSGLSVLPLNDHYTISWNQSSAGTFPIGGYRIYRSSTNDGHWKYLGSTSSLTYDDYPPSTGSSYYYTVTSFDNQTATSASDYASAAFAAPLGLNTVSSSDNQLSIYPNPSTDQININFLIEKAGNVDIELFDITGRKIAVIANSEYSAGRNQIAFSLSLAKGLYLVKFKSELSIMIRQISIQ